MAKPDLTIKTSEYRPCFLEDGTRGLFHRWEDKEQLMIKFNGVMLRTDKINDMVDKFKDVGYLPPGVDSERFRQTLAIVELDNGSIKEVEPHKVRFADSQGKFDEICWELASEEE